MGFVEDCLETREKEEKYLYVVADFREWWTPI